MATISRLTATNAKPIDATNWLAVRDAFGPQEIPDPSPRGDCVVQADTLPQNSTAEWAQIAWSGGEPIPGKANQRKFSRQTAGTTTITASIGGGSQKCVLWTLWADVSVLTKGPRPPQAQPWSKGVPSPDPTNAAPTKCNPSRWERMPADRSSPLRNCSRPASAKSFLQPANTRCSASAAN